MSPVICLRAILPAVSTTKTAQHVSPASAPSAISTPYARANSLSRKSLGARKFLIPSVEQNLPAANGRSIETTKTSVFFILAARSLNLRVSVAHTSVSSDGRAMMTCALPVPPPTLTSLRSDRD